MKQQWIDFCLDLAIKKEDFYANGNRKIFRDLKFKVKNVSNDLQLIDAGYTNSKMNLLKTNYYHEESIQVAQQLWDKRLGQKGYGSVSFTCFAHFVKGGAVDAKRAKRASVFGPCLQSVVMTRTPQHRTHIDVFYRTTELFKKFPADIVFVRDELLPNFNFDPAPIVDITFHFANATLHPMYFAVIIPHLEDPIGELEEIREKDNRYFIWVVKSTGRYLLPKYHNGIQKHSQSMSVYNDIHKRGDKKVLKELEKYLDIHHPGLRGKKNG